MIPSAKWGPSGGESKELPPMKADKDRRCSTLDRWVPINTSQAGMSCCSDNTRVDKKPHPSKALCGLERGTVRTMVPYLAAC